MSDEEGKVIAIVIVTICVTIFYICYTIYDFINFWTTGRIWGIPCKYDWDSFKDNSNRIPPLPCYTAEVLSIIIMIIIVILAIIILNHYRNQYLTQYNHRQSRILMRDIYMSNGIYTDIRNIITEEYLEEDSPKFEHFKFNNIV